MGNIRQNFLKGIDTAGSEQQAFAKGRVASIDALRGFGMFCMIGGGKVFKALADVRPSPVTETIKQQLTHVKWQGFHFEDLIFPLFLFVVGLVLPFSVSRRIEQGQSRRKLYLHIIKRSAVLVLLGLIYNNLLQFDFAQMRWMGVLQRIGLCYFFAAILVMHTGWRTQTTVAAAILLLYWMMLTFIPVPGFGAGLYTPQGCLTSYIDRLLLPGTFCCYGYGDTEGLLSTLPAVCTALLGVLAGHWLRSNRSANRKVTGLAAAGLASLVTGYIWGLFSPIIKNIWTSSYVLYSAGWSLLLLALFYWIIDVKGYKRWAFFFVVIGMNPITIYFVRKFVDFKAIALFFLGGIAGHSGIFEPLVLPLGILLSRWLFVWFLYRHRIFFKV